MLRLRITLKEMGHCLRSSTDCYCSSHYDPQLPLSLACDASSVGVEAVIFHTLPGGTEKVVAYACRKLSPAEKKYAQIQ